MLGMRAAQLLLITALLSGTCWSQQQISNLDRGRAQDMLQTLASEVRKHYYDPKFHGVDWDAKVAEGKVKIAKANSMNMAMSNIAATLDTLNDSHTFFVPPEHESHFWYGFEYQIIGNRCYVTQVRPKSDAETKGLKPGDEIVTFNTFNVNREDLWKVQYVFGVLRPQTSIQLELQDPAGSQRNVEVAAKIRAGKKMTDISWVNSDNIYNIIRGEETDSHLNRARFREYGDDLTVLKFPVFYFSATEIDDIMGKARKHQNLIIDLRGNHGGSVDTLKWLVGGVFDKEVKLYDRASRKETKAEMAKPRHDNFAGKLVVLVDAESASAAEIFARLVQIEKRGTVIGDRTAGGVMEARHYAERSGTDTAVFYGASITEADVIMTDGKSLEHVGVTPDEISLPSPQDLADARDPVLAHAAETLGVKISAEEAGKAFPYEWPPEN
jgi:carboxyl-terminal processing protease